MAAQAVRRAGISMVARSGRSGCSKSCDLWPAFAPCCTWSSGGRVLCRVTASQLDMPLPTPLSVAGCDRLQLGALHWATLVALLQVVDN